MHILNQIQQIVINKGFFRAHGLTVGLFAVLIIQVAITNFGYTNSSVLGYATNISITDLLSLTNQNRSNNGLDSLALNGKLNTAARNKAQHMIDNDYWDHYAPDGTSPWYFFQNAGYSYTKAGENLAYGFANSSGVMNGWMNSPPHAANILDTDYLEVGFGFADGENYQGGENTVVVAMYGTPTNPPPPQAPPTQQTTNPTPPPQTTSQPEPVATPSDTVEISVDEAPTELPEEPVEEPKAEDENESRPFNSHLDLTGYEGANIELPGGIPSSGRSNTYTNLEVILNGDAPISLYVTVSLLGILTIVYAARHIRAIYQVVVYGEHYIIGHPLLEAGLIYTTLWLVLIGTFGVVQ